MASIPSPIQRWVQEFITGDGSGDVADQAPVQSVNNNTGDVSLIGTDGPVEIRQANQQLRFRGGQFGARRNWNSYITVGENNTVTLTDPGLKLRTFVDGSGGISIAHASTGLTPEGAGPYELTFHGVEYSALANATELEMGFGADNDNTGFPLPIANDGAKISFADGNLEHFKSKDDPNNFIANGTLISTTDATGFSFPLDVSLQYDADDNVAFKVNDTVTETTTLDRTDSRILQPIFGIFDKGSATDATVDRVSYRPIDGVPQ